MMDEAGCEESYCFLGVLGSNIPLEPAETYKSAMDKFQAAVGDSSRAGTPDDFEEGGKAKESALGRGDDVWNYHHPMSGTSILTLMQSCRLISIVLVQDCFSSLRCGFYFACQTFLSRSLFLETCNAFYLHDLVLHICTYFHLDDQNNTVVLGEDRM